MSWPQSLRTAVNILLQSPILIVMLWGKDGVMIYNDAYSVFAGKRHPRLLGSKVLEGWPEVADFNANVMKIGLSGGTLSYRDQQLTLYRDGIAESVWMNLDYSPIIDESGRPAGVLAIVVETTGRIIGERRLRTLREVALRTASADTVETVCHAAVEAIAENSADIPCALFYLLDEFGRARLAASHGVEPGQAVGDLPLRTDEYADLARICDTGSPEEIETGRLAGRLLAPEAAGRMLVLPISAGTAVAGLLAIGLSPFLARQEEYGDFLNLMAVQISKAVATARALEEERKRAEALAEIDRAKTAFFSNVSHEFRTPLTLMLGPIEDALADRERPLSPEQRERVELMRRNAQRLLKLVNSLLDFSRIEAGRIKAVYEPTDLGSLTAELASVFRSAVEKAGLRFIVDSPPLSVPVHVDREMWEKIVLNLLSNAFKFTFEGEIEVALRLEGDRVELTVRDTGGGIPNEELPHLFKRFHQVRNTRARTYEGSGIGLALVQELVRLHGGTIGVESRVGHGTTFKVAIPAGTAHLPADRIGAARMQASTAIGSAPYMEEALRWLPERPLMEGALLHSRSPAPTSGSRVLLADDNADMRDYVTRLLSQRWRVQAVGDGAAALAAAREQAPDLVLADVMMPGMNGFELLRALRADPKTRDVPVILLSARAGEESRVEGLEAGADDYLSKPFSARELLARVAAHLELARLRREGAEALRQSMEEAQSASRMKSQLVSNVSHELRTPLNGIIGYSALLLEEAYGPVLREQKGPLQGVLRNAHDLLKLINDLLDLSRIEARSLPITLEPVDVPALLDDVVIGMKPLLEGKGLRVTREIEKNLPAVTSDTGKMKQIFTNLFSNAVKFTEEGGIDLAVRNRPDRNGIEITVRDTGVGIGPQDLPRIFDAFHQIDADLTREYGGVGLGLTIVKEIVALLRGAIRVESKLGRGSAFTVFLPYRFSTEPPAETSDRK